ncbi:hypothetical protein [Lentzea cavernae]|uniref:Uncharacterized protein n=1 Tax=Lentzea cavernae TaxID=2020703 RepID=A0ABQ3MPU7_9PSEU|nr:hypothetical protein [Lentzea cavernae]GHH42562.1 hypothetical protein GCM10017774_39140 [Lentzea cavernae]
MNEISPEDLTKFCQEVAELRERLTSEPQRKLLDNILGLAWAFSTKQQPLTTGFDGCFTADEAGLLLAYDLGDSGTGTKLIQAVSDGPVFISAKVIGHLIK